MTFLGVGSLLAFTQVALSAEMELSWKLRSKEESYSRRLANLSSIITKHEARIYKSGKKRYLEFKPASGWLLASSGNSVILIFI